MNVIVDIAREVKPEVGMVTAQEVIKHYGDGVCALGLGGYEVGHPPEKFRDSFDLVNNRLKASPASCTPAKRAARTASGARCEWGIRDA